MTEWLGFTPRRWQPEALEAVRGAWRSGVHRAVVQAATGAGKGLWLAEVAARAPGSVVLTVPTQALVEQLGSTLRARLGAVGLAYQHEWTPGARVVVTCAASLPRLLAERPTWDLWLSDEAHRGLPAEPAAKWAVALTATPFRGLTGWEKLVYAYSAAQATEDGVLVPLRVVRYDGAHDHLPEDSRTDAAVRAFVAQAEGPGIITAQTVAEAEAFVALTPGTAVVSGYQPRAERARLLAALAAGELRALVSVRLLSEGVDLPHLRWLALRVPVASPVALVQLVGRVLRAHPGKSSAVVYDPHGTLDAVGLTHTAALDSAAASAPEEPPQWEIPELLGLGEAWASLPAPVAVAAWEGWVADLRARLAAAWELPRPAPDRGAKAAPEQRKRLATLQGRAVGRLPAWSREAFRWLLEHESLSRGAAQDAIDALAAVDERRRSQLAQGRPWWMVSGALVPAAPVAP